MICDESLSRAKAGCLDVFFVTGPSARYSLPSAPPFSPQKRKLMGMDCCRVRQSIRGKKRLQHECLVTAAQSCGHPERLNELHAAYLPCRDCLVCELHIKKALLKKGNGGLERWKDLLRATHLVKLVFESRSW